MPELPNSPDHLPTNGNATGHNGDELMLALIGVAAMVALLFGLVALKAAV